MTTTQNSGATIEHEIGARGELALRIHTGMVEVVGTDGETVVIRDRDRRDLSERFDIERSAGRLVVRPRDRVVLDLGGGRGGAAHLDVELPRAAALSLDTASGGVRAEGLVGDQRYRTASGDLQLDGVSGPISLDAVSGSVQVHGAGSVELSGRLVSGDLEVVDGQLDALSLSTTSGDVRLEAPLAGPGPFSVQTVSGDVHLTPGPGGLRVEARTVTGDVRADGAHTSQSARGVHSLVVGDGAASLAFKSISGDLRLATPTAPATGAAVSHAAPVPSAPAPADLPDQLADRRLEILRELEAGTIDITTATDRLAELEDSTDG